MNYFYTIHCSGCSVIASHPIADDTHLSATQVLAQATHGDECPVEQDENKTVEIDASNPKNVVYTIS